MRYLPRALQELQDELKARKAEHNNQQAELRAELQHLREQVAGLPEAGAGLVTGVGFRGIYAALRVTPFRFRLICTFAVGRPEARFALRDKAFARQLSGWLLSRAAAIFLFAGVAAVRIEGLRWAAPPFDYLLLLAGVSAHLLLAWCSRREDYGNECAVRPLQSPLHAGRAGRGTGRSGTGPAGAGGRARLAAGRPA